MKKSLIVLPVSLALFTTFVNAKVNCNDAVENQIQIMKTAIDKSKPGADFYLKMLDNPAAKEKGIKQCMQDIKSEKGSVDWTCVQNSKSKKDLKSCE